MADNLPVDPGVPSDLSVPAMILPPGAQARIGAPVVASGNNVPRPMTLQNSSFTPYTPVEYQRQEAPPEMAPEMTQRQRLADFFFGMANSQSPSFFGAIGQAGQALSAADRQRATAAREDRRTQVEENYRAAQIAVENAKLAQEREPTPANIARLATAQAQVDSARAALIRAQREPTSDPGRMVIPNSEFVSDGRVYQRTQTGQTVPVMGANNQPMTEEQYGRISNRARIPQIEDTRRRAAESRYIESVRANPIAAGTMTPEQIYERAAEEGERAVIAFRRTLSPSLGGSGEAPGTRPSGGGNVPAYDPLTLQRTN